MYAYIFRSILFNISGTSSSVHELLAYDVSGDKWYPVKVENEECNELQGTAVVTGKTIYVLSNRLLRDVLAFSMARDQTKSDHSAFCYGCYDYQSIKVTTLELVGDTEIHVKHSTVYDVPLQDFMSLDVNSASRHNVELLNQPKKKRLRVCDSDGQAKTRRKTMSDFISCLERFASLNIRPNDPPPSKAQITSKQVLHILVLTPLFSD
ncbi:hypothetical protein M0R45_031506 [Rubus argutus]|uniref:Uncharacterized protein n=1 Tax=Rubus argutus TaxID=59490 RepID=A0AAW1WIC6_RUBAR